MNTIQIKDLITIELNHRQRWILNEYLNIENKIYTGRRGRVTFMFTQTEKQKLIDDLNQLMQNQSSFAEEIQDILKKLTLTKI